MLDSVKGVFRMTWFSCIIGGFYIVAYAFWVPGLFVNVPIGVLAVAVTLALGGGLLIDGWTVAHWPLDLALTLVAGARWAAYGSSGSRCF